MKEHILQLVARLSSRVFLGEELCRDSRWLDITINYTVDAFMAAEELRLWNPLLRPFVHWFLPRCRRLRAQIKEAYSTIEPVLEKRRMHKASAAATGGEARKYEDTIEWFESLAKGRAYDPIRVQLGLSIAAIHTTTDLITQTLFDLAEHHQFIEPLRDEITKVVAVEGWTKTALFKMKLLDSIIKETQRMKPISLGMCRPFPSS
jgi:cytochrome P450